MGKDLLLLGLYCVCVLSVPNNHRLSQVSSECTTAHRVPLQNERGNVDSDVRRVRPSTGCERRATSERGREHVWEVERLYETGNHDRLDRRVRALVEGESELDSTQISIVSEYDGLAHFWRDQMEQGRRAFERALRHGVHRPDGARLNLQISYATLFLRTGALGEAERQLERAHEIRPAHRLPVYARAKMAVIKSSVLLERALLAGRVSADVRAQMDEAGALLHRTGVRDPELHTVQHVHEGGVALIDGDLASARRHLDRARRLSTNGGEKERASVHLMQARLDTARHDFSAALRSLDRAETAARNGRWDLLAVVEGTRAQTLTRMEQYLDAYRSLQALDVLPAPGASAQHVRAQRVYVVGLTGAMQWAWGWGSTICIVLGVGAMLSVLRSVPIVYRAGRTLVRRYTGGQEEGETSRPDGTDEADEGSAPDERVVWGAFDAVDDWTLSGDAGGTPPDDVDVVPRHPSVTTPDRMDPQIPTLDRPVPRMVRPALILERYRPDGTFEGLVGVPSWLIEEVLRRQVFVLDLGDTFRIVLRLREGTRTVLVSATRSGVRWQTVPLTVLGLPLYDLPPSETMTGQE